MNIRHVHHDDVARQSSHGNRRLAHREAAGADDGGQCGRDREQEHDGPHATREGSGGKAVTSCATTSVSTRWMYVRSTRPPVTYATPTAQWAGTAPPKVATIAPTSTTMAASRMPHRDCLRGDN